MAMKGRLLVVDDDALQLKALCDALRGEGCEVVGCADGDAALAELAAKQFDVLLTDLNMPGMNGIALMQRALAADPDLVPVLMTGHGAIATAVEAMKEGALDYVLKPFRLAAIRPMLARALEVRRLRVHNRALQENVQRQNAELEAANRELDAFASRAAHDLRGPLQGMLGFARLVHERSERQLDAETLSYLRYVITAGERAERLIRDLLAFARTGGRPLERAAVKLDAVVHDARRMVEPQARGRTVQWRVGPLPEVNGDASLLEQVFVNLLSNALKFTRTRDIAQVEVGAEAVANGHRIWVRDNGVGFDPAYAERLFVAFERLHRADQFEGTGLGLANVKRVVERHGGTVGATSQPGAGATFTIELP
jgi:signal transduction histidine kinase